MAIKKSSTKKRVFPKVSKEDLKEVFPSLSKSINKEAAEITFGEKVVGVDFNPSGSFDINHVKKLSAEIIDIMRLHYMSNDNPTELNKMLYESAVAQVLNAQMNVVKVLTFKH